MKEPIKQEKRLGRGLSALLGDNRSSGNLTQISQASNSKDSTIEAVSINKIIAGVYQPRRSFHQDEIEELKVALSVPVYSYDERLTSKTANESMMQANMKAQARRRIVDKIAAAVMLQGWLEHVDRNQK